jgi:hypothetical protein
MATMNFSIPDDVKEAFNAEFATENKSAIVTDLMRKAVEARARAEPVTEAERQRRIDAAIERLNQARATGRTYDDDQIRRARREGRP